MKRKCGILVLLTALFLALFALNAQAECAHNSTVLKKVRSATCCVAGRYDRYCKTCGVRLKTNAYCPAATGQHPGATGVVTKAPTCTSDGVVSVRCTKSNKEINTCVIPKLGHNTSSKVLRKPTCTTTGSVQISCSRCTFTTSTTLPKLGHSMNGGSVHVPSTCTTKGYLLVHCSRCSYYTKAYEPLAAHQWISSSHYEDGAEYSYWYKECEVCGLSESGRTLMK